MRKYSVLDGMIESKSALESGKIGNPEDAMYNNFASVLDLGAELSCSMVKQWNYNCDQYFYSLCQAKPR